MAVKIDQLNDLQETSNLLSDYSSAIQETVGSIDTKIVAKFEGQKTEAFEAYLSTINEMTGKVFTEFPNSVSRFSSALGTYYGAITGEGFSSKVRSSKPGVEEDYCTKVTGDEASDIEDEAKKVKTAFEDVLSDSDASSAIGGDPLGTISSALSTFDTELSAQISQIKTTRSNLETANKELISKLTDVTASIQECRAAMNTFSIMANPAHGFSAATVLSLIKNGKLTVENMNSTLNAVKKKNDAKAIEYVLLEKYDKYFALDPAEISDVPNQLLVVKISDAINFPSEGKKMKKQKDFQDIMNQLLSSGSELHIEGHLGNMLKASDTLALQYATLLAGGADSFGHTLTAKEQLYLEDKLAKMNAMGALYMTLYALEMPDVPEPQAGYAGVHTVPTDTIHKYDLKNLKLSAHGNFVFDIETTNKITVNGEVTEGKTTKSYTSSFHNDITSSQLASEGEKLYELQKERQEYLKNLMKENMIGIVGIFNPAIGSGLSFLNNLTSQNHSGLVSSSNSLGKLKLDKNNPYHVKVGNAMDVGNSLLGMMLDYDKMMEESKATGDEIQQNMISILLGKGGRSGSIVLGPDDETVFVAETGIPTVDSIKRLNELNANGISNYEYSDNGMDIKEIIKKFMIFQKKIRKRIGQNLHQPSNILLDMVITNLEMRDVVQRK